MSLAPEKHTPPPPRAEESTDEVTSTAIIPPPLDAIEARTKPLARGQTRPRLASPPWTAVGRRTKLRRAPSRPGRRPVLPGEVVVGVLAGLNDAGEALVRHPLDPSGRVTPARTTVPLDATQVDREVVLAFERGDTGRPIILGLLHRTSATMLQAQQLRTVTTPDRSPMKVTSDGERLVFSAEQEIVLQCGEASITLTRAGKVLIRGAYLLSRSSGVNRIKGGSVQIN